MMDRRTLMSGAAASAAGLLLPEGAAADAGAAPRVAIRRSADRGRFDYGWLDTRHTFSFSRYVDRRWMGFRSLRVINEDWVRAGGGFPMHPHEDMEIITYVLSGALEHKDSLGHGSVIVPGEVQRMSAGTGIRHSEFNPSRTEDVHLLQIWIQPNVRGVKPSYAQKVFPDKERTDTLRLVASPDGRDGSLEIHQDARLLAGTLTPGKRVTWRTPPGRHVWIQVARGSLEAADQELRQGDGAWTNDAGDLPLRGGPNGAEVLLFDLA